MSENYPSFKETNICPASLIQLQFWVINKFEPDSPAYNLPSISMIEGDVDVVALDAAINVLTRRYPIFRTTFDIDDSGIVLQRVAPWQRLLIPQDDLRPSPGTTADENIINQAVLEEINKPFDLAFGPPLRCKLYRSGERSYLFIVTAYHIVFDLVTKDLFAEELAKEYKAALLKQTETELNETADYAAFCAWQKDWMQGDDFKKMEASWRRYLDGMEPSLTWITDRPPETVSTHEPVIPPIHIKLTNELLEKIHAFCRKEKTTPFLVMLTAWALTLARYSGQTKLCVGVPLTNRRREEFKNTMGCFVNSLPLTFDISDNPTIMETVRRVRMGILQLHRMQEMPYYHLVQLMRRQGVIGGNTLYQAGFTFEHPMRLRLEGLRVEPKYIHPGGAQLDLFATFWQETDSIVGVIKYDSGLFNSRTVELIGNALQDTAHVICEHPQHKVDTVTLIPAKDIDGNKKDVSAHQPVAAASNASDTGTPVMAVAASFTAEFLQEFLEFWFQRLGWRFAVSFAPFNQVFQELLNPSSLLRSNRRGHNVILVRIEDLIDKEASSSWDTEETGIRLTRALDELREALATGAKSMSIPLCFVMCPPSPHGRKIQNLAGDTIEKFLEALRSIPGVIVLTFEDIHQRYPVADYYEPLGETIGAIPFTRQYLAALATAVVRSLHTLSLKPIKALVLDCDGTLWQGVVGEDGPTGVIIGQWQRAFQEFLIKQYQAGVILCLCSKNQEADVWSVFDQNPGMPLRREHISFWKINWEAKSANLRALVKEMNIGMDSVAFLDDNPLERAEVGLRFPSVFCPEIPDAWEERTKWLEHVWLLDHPRATAEDRKRQDHYRSEQIRENIKQSAESLSEFLEKLELKIDLAPAEEADYDRLAQLSVRTNQFNTTTLRLTTREVAEYATKSGMSADITRVRDRFGDYGLVGAMLAREVEGAYKVEGIFLSCRALGRSVEYRMASYLASKAWQAGLTEIVFPMRTTDRNEPARNFLKKLNELCGGMRDSEGSIHLNAEQLAKFRYESIPESVENTEVITPQEATEATGNLPVQKREPFVRLAGELRLVDAILNAVEKRTRKRQKKSVPVAAASSATPESKTEKLIAEAWKKILGLAQVSTQAKFFEVGGTSLLMVRVVIELRRNHGMKVSIIDMFKYPTIAELASHLDGKETAAEISSQAATETAIRQREILNAKRLPGAFKRLKETRG
jgi:FkbH-like protein